MFREHSMLHTKCMKKIPYTMSQIVSSEDVERTKTGAPKYLAPLLKCPNCGAQLHAADCSELSLFADLVSISTTSRRVQKMFVSALHRLRIQGE